MDDERRWDTGVRYDDRETSGRGRFAAAFKRIFGDGENFFSWALPLFTLRGIRVRLHLLMIVYLLAELARAISASSLGLVFIAPILGSLFVLVLLHEFGHCWACRRVGGQADEIVMWPLGGLAMCRPPRTWKADLATTLGGPAVNAALLAVFTPAVYIATQSVEATFFNPFDPVPVLSDPAVGGSLAKRILWSAHYVNVVLLLLNAIPVFPMDGGRVLQALVWRKRGHHESIMITTMTGFVVAGLIGVAAGVSGMTRLLLIMGFGFLVCYQERQRAKLLHTGSDGTPLPGMPGAPEEPEDDAPEPDQAREEADQAELDRVLAKISREGIDALTGKERRLLKRATRRSRETQ